MASSLPFALRVAAGLVAETIETLRRLPAELPTLPVTVVGRAAKLSFQLNQQLTTWATAGDELIAGLQRPGDPPERTVWSTIDEESEVAASDPQAAPRWDSVEDAVEDEPSPRVAAVLDGDAPSTAPEPATRDAAAAAPADDPERDPTRLTTDGAHRFPHADSPVVDEDGSDPFGTFPVAPADGPDAGTLGPFAGPAGDRTTEQAAPQTTGHVTDGPSDRTDAARRSAARIDAADDSDQDSTESSTVGPAGSPTPLPSGYATLTVAQLRYRLRGLGIADLRGLLEHEQSHLARPAFLTLLTNRLTTLERSDA